MGSPGGAGGGISLRQRKGHLTFHGQCGKEDLENASADALRKGRQGVEGVYLIGFYLKCDIEGHKGH